jgi:hypothetical protein
VGGDPLEQNTRRLVVIDLIGQRNQPSLRDGDLLCVAAGTEECGDPTPVANSIGLVYSPDISGRVCSAR